MECDSVVSIRTVVCSSVTIETRRNLLMLILMLMFVCSLDWCVKCALMLDALDVMLCQYEVHGHSGEGHSFEFVKSDMPPKNMKERLDILLVSWLCHGLYGKHKVF